MFIGLNPSTADEVEDDRTVRRCINYAMQWGFGALCMTNLFAFRATDPSVMKAFCEPIGPENDETLDRLSKDAGIIIAAWGKDGNHLYRASKVKMSIPVLHCLKKNSDGSPAHPLYLKKNLKPFLLNHKNETI